MSAMRQQQKQNHAADRHQNNNQNKNTEQEEEEEEEDRPVRPHRPRSGPAPSVDGWVVFVTGLHAEAREDDVTEAFSEYGRVTAVHMNSRQAQACVKFQQQSEAQDSINSLHGTAWWGQTLGVHWAFVKATASSGTSSSRGQRR